MTVAIGQQSRTGIYWSIGLKIVHQSYHVIVMLVVARILGPSAFGVMAFAWAIMALAEQWTRFGFTKAVVQNQSLSPRQTQAAFSYCLAASIAMGACLVSAAPCLSRTFGVPELKSVLPSLTVLLPMSVYSSFCMALLQREMRFRFFAMIGLVLGMTQSTVALVLTLSGYGLWALVLGRLVAQFVVVTVLIIGTGWVPRLNWRIGDVSPMFNYAVLVLLRAQMRYVEKYLSYWLVGFNMAPNALGLLDRAQSIADVPQLTFQNQVAAILFPSFSHLRNDQSRLRRAFAKTQTSASLLAMGPLVGLASVSGLFIPIVLGAEWVPMTTTLQILCMASLFRILASTSNSLNLATEGYRHQTIAAGIATIVTVVACPVGMRWGVEGVASGLLAAAVTRFVLSSIISLRVLRAGPRLLIDCLMPATLGGLITALTVWIFGHTILASPTPVSLVCLIIIGAIAYVIWAISIRHDEVRALRRDIIDDLLALLRRTKPPIDQKSN